MGYTFRSDLLYRMPTHFGPSIGPRQGPNGRRFACIDTPKQTIVQAAFDADKNELARFLPPGFALREPHQIQFSFAYITDIEWLAGRGYNTFGVSIPAAFNGQVDNVSGDLLLVLWENMADPIITGREELGFSKVYCDIPSLSYLRDSVSCVASWDGHQFVSLELAGLKKCPQECMTESVSSEGLLHYKYVPKTGHADAADAEYATLTPNAEFNTTVIHCASADRATCKFRRSTWEELPTLCNIVNALSSISIGECVSAFVANTQGAKDLSDQRILL